MRFATVTASALALIASGCIDQPLVEPTVKIDSTFQQRMHSAREWQFLAQQTVQSLDAAKQLNSGASYYLDMDDSSPFLRGYETFLVEELKKTKNISIQLPSRTPPNGSIWISIRTQLITEKKTFPTDPLTTGAILSYYGAQAAKWIDGAAEAALTAFPAMVLADNFLTAPDAEFIVTTAIPSKCYWKTWVYYASTKDAETYRSRKAKPITSVSCSQ